MRNPRLQFAHYASNYVDCAIKINTPSNVMKMSAFTVFALNSTCNGKSLSCCAHQQSVRDLGHVSLNTTSFPVANDMYVYIDLVVTSGKTLFCIDDVTSVYIQSALC